MQLKVPSQLTLFPYQEEGIRKVLNQDLRRVLLADEMGLGKSPQAVVLSNHWDPQHTVVICPAVMRSTWDYEFKRWSTRPLSVEVINSGKDLKRITNITNLIIISYDLASHVNAARILLNYLRTTPAYAFATAAATNGLLICDESHYIRNWTARRTLIAFNYLVPATTRTLFLTGTPIVRCVTDLHPIITSCEATLRPPRKAEDFEDFATRYSFPCPTPYGSGIEYRGLRNVPELKLRLNKFMIRRFKKQVQKDLPSIMYANVLLDIPTSPATALHDEDIETVRQLITNSDNARTQTAKNYSTLRRELGLVKLPAIFDWISERLEQNQAEPLVIFAIHKDVVAALVSFFETKFSITPVTITGSTTPKQKAKAISDFQEGKSTILIANIIAAGVGITLTKASTCIMAELDWSAVSTSQAISRLHRIGQKRTVFVYFMVAAHTLDEVVIDTIRRKLDVEQKVLGKECKRKRKQKPNVIVQRRRTQKSPMRPHSTS